MSYCPKCGRRIYKEEEGCEFCGVVNDRSLWQGIGGIKSQTGSLDYEYKEMKGKPQKEISPKSIESKREQMNQEDTQKEPEKAEASKDGNVFSLLRKGMLIAMSFLIPPVGALIGFVTGFFLWRSSFEDHRKFGKIMLLVSAILLLISLVIKEAPKQKMSPHLNDEKVWIQSGNSIIGADEF